MLLYSMPSSGNSYKVRLLMALTGQFCQQLDCESGSAELQGAKDSGALPFGKLPALHLDDGTMLAESNAILCYLGEGSDFWPADRAVRAAMFGWMFWEQYSHEPVVAVRAALRRYPDRAHLATPERMAELLDRGHAVLQIMEDRLTNQPWLAGKTASLADICLYGYSHTAGDYGGFEIARFPAIRDWCARIASMPGYVAIDA